MVRNQELDDSGPAQDFNEQIQIYPDHSRCVPAGESVIRGKRQNLGSLHATYILMSGSIPSANAEASMAKCLRN